jgi:hypothetical protein
MAVDAGRAWAITFEMSEHRGQNSAESLKIDRFMKEVMETGQLRAASIDVRCPSCHRHSQSAAASRFSDLTKKGESS